MIKDVFDNAEIYYGISENLKIGFEWLKSNDLQSIKNGKYVINDNVYANVQDYITKDDALYEAHKRYIDIQCMIKGEELVGITNIKNCKICQQYDHDKDIAFFKCVHNEEYFKLVEGEFIVLFPSDAHKPSVKCIENQKVKKVVVKVLL